MNTKSKRDSRFTYISLDVFLKKQLISSPETNAKELKESLIHFRNLKYEGVTCECGNELWIVGSAFSGKGCFTCITGEADCSSDYEIA